MNKLDELIRGLCPDGVEFKKIKEVYKRIKGRKKQYEYYRDKLLTFKEISA